MNFRRHRAQYLCAAIMEEIQERVPHESLHEVHDALLTVLERNGACIVTEQDRAEMGLEPRDDLGWTPSERIKDKHLREQAMLTMMFLSDVLDGEGRHVPLDEFWRGEP